MNAEYIKALDEYFCSHYTNYIRLSAIEGYRMPDMIEILEDGNISRRDATYMRLCHQAECEVLLQRFKDSLTDAYFTFSFNFPGWRERWYELFHRHTFSKFLPQALRHCGETVQSAGSRLDVAPKYWNGMVKGKLEPQKTTIFALALTCRMQWEDVATLLLVSGFEFDSAEVLDVVVRYIIEQKIFNEQMRDACLSEYHIRNLPILRDVAQNT